ncbi:MAG: apolipoprotein N-acyltransferase [Spirochaetia bacterium]|nr:apolipoprotein N-acyltransferase [Spirochaetia bacterium]
MSKAKITAALICFGALTGLSFPPFNLWPFGFLALIPVFYIIGKTNYNLKHTFFLSWFITLSFNIFIAYWLVYTIAIYGHIPWILAMIIFLLFTLISCSRYLFFLILIKIWKNIPENSNARFFKIIKNKYISWTFFWGLSEFSGWQLFHALGANSAGGDMYLLQTADLFGIYGVSLLWFLTNLLIYDIIILVLENKSRWKYSLLYKNVNLIVVSFILVCAHIYGFVSMRYWENTNEHYEKRKIALVQGNAPLGFESMKSIYEQLMDILKSIENQTINMLKKSAIENNQPELVIWPESSVPFLSFQAPGEFSKTISNIQKKYKTAMIINDIYVEQTGLRNRFFNNLWLLGADESRIGYYHKIRLLPFGEFIPLGNFFPGLYKLVPEIGGFTSGNEKKTLYINSMHILPSICYELLPPDFTLDFFQESGKNAQLVVNITNDTWFGQTTEVDQHIKASSIRAIELRLPIIRATNSGISAYIDTTGRIHNPTESYTKDYRIYDIPIPDKSHSIYSIVGLWPFKIFLLINILFWLPTGYSMILARRRGTAIE